MPRAIPDITRRKMAIDCEAGMSQSQAAKKYGVSKPTVGRACREFGVSNPKGKRETPISEETLAAIRADEAAGMPVTHIAKKHGFGMAVVRRAIGRVGNYKPRAANVVPSDVIEARRRELEQAIKRDREWLKMLDEKRSAAKVA